jgi:hypothetical protein
MSQATVVGLGGAAQRLSGYVGFAPQNGDASVTPWLVSTDYSLITQLHIKQNYVGIVQRPVASQGNPTPPIVGIAALPMRAGQVFTANADGSFAVREDGTSPNYTFVNLTSEPLAAGLAMSDRPTNALILAPLYGNNSSVLMARPRVLLFFGPLAPPSPSSNARTTGPGLIFDFAQAHAAAVTFDLNDGWSPTGTLPSGVQITPVTAGTLIAPLLFDP